MQIKRILPLLALLLLCGCAAPAQEPEPAPEGLTLAATTYPVYLFAQELTQDIPELTVTLVVNEQLSCMHDYSLSITDMKVLEGADAVLLSGAGLEDSMAHALRAAARPQIDASQGIDLFCSDHDHDHDHKDGDHGEEEEMDPHIWLDPRRACQMLENLAQGIAALDPDHASQLAANAEAAQEQITARYAQLKDQLAGLTRRDLITFHDGFAYFADAFDLHILRAIEEEAGSEASALEVRDILKLIDTHQLPAVFTEVNGADATARLIAREAQIQTVPLDLLMSRRDTALQGVELYLQVLSANVNAIQEAYSSCAVSPNNPTAASPSQDAPAPASSASRD